MVKIYENDKEKQYKVLLHENNGKKQELHPHLKD